MTKKFEIIYTNIIENLESNVSYGYWISPNGEIYPVGYQNHGGIANKIISKNKKYSEYFHKQVSDHTSFSTKILMAIRFLMSNGWIKVQADSTTNTLFFSKNKPATTKQKDSLLELSKDFNLDIEEDHRWNK